MESTLKHPSRKNSPSASKTISDAPIAFHRKALSPAQGIHIEHLKNQYDHLLVLHEYHVDQMNRAKNRQLFEKHRDLADTISRAISQYEALLISSEGELE